MEWFDPKENLPPNNIYVLVHVPGSPWRDSDDMIGVFYKIAKFERGISMKERSELTEGSERKITYRREDEHGNNHLPYCWSEFGPGYFFGQEVARWAFIPTGSQPAEKK